MIEGGSSRNYIETKKLMYASAPPPEIRAERSGVEGPRAAWSILMDKLITVLADYAAQQVAAGADVIQVFDSWVGALSPSDYRDYALAPTTDLIRRIQALGVPVIYFGVDTASLLPIMRETGCDVLGLDWRTPLDQAWRDPQLPRRRPGQPRPHHPLRPARSPRSPRRRNPRRRRQPPRPHLQPRPRHRPHHPRRRRPPVVHQLKSAK